MTGVNRRPFYGSFAWAYDLLSERSIPIECAQIGAMLGKRGVPPGGRLLDAGCGTGRHSVELARRGFRVTGLDASGELLAVARQQPGADGVIFVQADLAAPPPGPFEAILCRGVLNDLVEDETRRRAFLAFARALVAAGALVLDVRDWVTTVRRKGREPITEKTVETPRGTLTFRSETRLEHGTQRLQIAERHTLTSGGVTTIAANDFTMRCWTREELDALLAATGFRAVEYRASYDPAAPAGSTDRLVVTASRA
jgi:SAM-dependent methyltransferase